MSLKRVNIDEKLLWRAYRNQRTFERYQRRPLRPLLPKIGVRNPKPKLQSLLSQETVKLRTWNLAGTFTGFIRTKAHETFGRTGSVGVSRDFPIFWVPPTISGKVKVRTSNFVKKMLSSSQISCTHNAQLSQNTCPHAAVLPPKRNLRVQGAARHSRLGILHAFAGADSDAVHVLFLLCLIDLPTMNRYWSVIIVSYLLHFSGFQSRCFSLYFLKEK